MQYVHSKTDDPRRVTKYTVRELSYRKHKNWKKIFENQCQTSFHVGLEFLFEQRERAIGMLTAGMYARHVARHFQRHESTISRLLNSFQLTWNVADRPRSGRPRKTTPREDRFLTTLSRRYRFLSSRKLGRLLRNATGTKVCDGTVRNRLHAARLKASPCWHSADVMKLSSLMLYRIYNNIALGFSNMIMPVHTLRGIRRTFYASITLMCCSGLQDHRISLPLSTYRST